MEEKPNPKPQDVPNNIRPSLPVAGTSNPPGVVGVSNQIDAPQESFRTRCCRYMYDRDKKTFCERTCESWLYIIVYSIMYLIFLSTYMLMCLYVSLIIIKMKDDYETIEKTELLIFSARGIGLSATPTSLNTMPLIWYRNDSQDYQKYIDELNNLLKKRSKRQVTNCTDLGPCAASPFGYGDNPCVIVRINKQLKWSARPLNTSYVTNMNIPSTVRNWLKLERQKLWLHCDGYHSYDKEHIGKIKYYPDPPGYDPNAFPLEKNSNAPVIAIQISEFTLGVSLAVQCNLWYESGVSSTEFVLYVTPRRK